MINSEYHLPVMADEVIRLLAPERGGIYVDCTMGGGGHTLRILEALGDGGTVIGIDRDDEAISQTLNSIGCISRLKVLKGNFGNLNALLGSAGILKADGFLFDLGVSSHQLDVPERGFSFRTDAKLDMRMDRSEGLSAYELINTLSVKDLERIFRDYGEEKWAGRIAREIESQRDNRPIETTFELAECIEKSIPYTGRKYKIHPATRVFMALRIAVNRELQNLERGVRDALSLASCGARIVVISYHSLEDRIVKHMLKNYPVAKDPVYGTDIYEEDTKRIRVLTKKPLLPTEEEIAANARARSAKVRAVEILNNGGIKLNCQQF